MAKKKTVKASLLAKAIEAVGKLANMNSNAFPEDICNVKYNIIEGAKVKTSPRDTQWQVAGITIDSSLDDGFFVWTRIMRPAIDRLKGVEPSLKQFWLEQNDSVVYQLSDDFDIADDMEFAVANVYFGQCRNPYDIKESFAVDRTMKKCTWLDRSDLDKEKAEKFEFYDLLKSARNILEQNLLVSTFTEWKSMTQYADHNKDYERWIKS